MLNPAIPTRCPFYIAGVTAQQDVVSYKRVNQFLEDIMIYFVVLSRTSLAIY